MRILLLNQTFYPDEIATSQYASDLALALTAAGHEVTVLCSGRGYDDPSRRFRNREVWHSIRIIRVQGTSFGKSAKWRRAADFASFLIACALRLPHLGRFDVIVALTSPPLISVLGAAWKQLRGGRLVSWIMDLNPDEAIAAGWLQPCSKTATLLLRIQDFSMRHSDRVLVLDRFMRSRLICKGTSPDKISTIPLWPQEIAFFHQSGRDRFRRSHRWTDKFVVMYSGNHSPCHSLDTLLAAALQLRDRPDILFAFVGGGSEHRRIKARVESEKLRNVICLPYQPREALAESLSAGDLQVVIMGNAFVGIVSPSKIYNILQVGTPVLYIGPTESHITELLTEHREQIRSYSAEHTDIQSVLEHILDARNRGFQLPLARTPNGRTALLRQMVEAITEERCFVFDQAA